MSETSDHVGTLGRDGAYLELDETQMSALFESIRLGSEFPAKMITIKAARMELSDPEDVKNFKKAVASILDGKETECFNDAQMGAYILRKIFREGVAVLASTSK